MLANAKAMANTRGKAGHYLQYDKSLAKHKYTFYNEDEDIIFILDGSAQQCIQQGNIIISPQDIVINSTERDKFTELTLDQFLNNFCKFVQTIAQYTAFELEK